MVKDYFEVPRDLGFFDTYTCEDAITNFLEGASLDALPLLTFIDNYDEIGKSSALEDLRLPFDY